MSEKLSELKVKFDAGWEERMAAMRKAESLQGVVKAGEKENASSSQRRHAKKAKGRLGKE